MAQEEIIKTMSGEIKLLEDTLDEINPNWFNETISGFTDADGMLSASVCVPVRCAIKLLKEQKNEQKINR